MWFIVANIMCMCVQVHVCVCTDRCGDLELLHHIELKEAADAALNQVRLRQREVTETELQELHILRLRDVGSLYTNTHTMYL